MAGEKKGKAFEALIVMALERNGYKRDRDLHWCGRAETISVDPDIVLGQLAAPTHWILATTSVSPNNSNMKFWRNAGEVFEVKRSYETPPALISMVLESNQEEGLIDAMDHISDAALHLDRFRQLSPLVQMLAAEAPRLSANRDLLIRELESHVESSANLRSSLEFLAGEIQRVLRLKNRTLQPLWNLLRSDYIRKKPFRREAKRTFLKRALAKLLLLTAEERRTLYIATKAGKAVKSLPKFAIDLDYGKKSIAGVAVVDEELRWIAQTMQLADIEHVITQTLTSSLGHWVQWIKEIRESPAESRHQFVLENAAQLRTREGMRSLLRKCETEGQRWLFWHLIEIFKAASGKKQGYGFAVLAEDVGYKQGISQGYKVLADWANGTDGGKASKALIDDVADALARRLRLLGDDKLKGIGERIYIETLSNLFEQKIVSYPYFEPIPILLSKTLSDAGIDFLRQQRHPTWIGEYLGRESQLPVPLFICGSTAIHWKSGYEQGKHHKVKELSGKGPAIRYGFERGSFARRSEIRKTILVIDGTFDSADLTVLNSAGWDEIYYPDEIGTAVSAIV